MPVEGVRTWGIRFRTLLMVVVGLGVVLRIIAVVQQAVPEWDGAHMAVMGATFASGKGFLIPYEEVSGPVLEPYPSHWFPPMWPVVLAVAYRLAGYSIATTMATSLFVSLVLILVVFHTTKDLLGVEKAWIVTAIASLDFYMIGLAARAYAENLLVIFYVVTIWAILRSLKDERYVVLAGLFAGAAYLTKSAIGYFFILAGTVGFLWRFYYMRWGVLRNRYYLTAIGIFMACVMSWATRNILDFGWPNWETDPHNTSVLIAAFGKPFEFLPVLAAKGVLFTVFLGMIGLFFAPQLLRGLRLWKDEAHSALLLSIVLPAIIGGIFAASFTLAEWNTLPFDTTHLRYIVVASVPLLWFVLYDEPVSTEVRLAFRLPRLRQIHLPRGRSLVCRIALVAIAGFAFVLVDHMIGVVFLFGVLVARRNGEVKATKIAVLICVLGLASVNMATTVYRYPDYAAGEFLAKVVHDGDTIGIYEGYHRYISPYLMHFFLADRQIQFVEWDGRNVTWLLTGHLGNWTGYRLIATFNFTQSEGILDSAYRALNYRVRTFLGLTISQGPPSPGDLFLYRSTLATSYGNRLSAGGLEG